MPVAAVADPGGGALPLLFHPPNFFNVFLQLFKSFACITIDLISTFTNNLFEILDVTTYSLSVFCWLIVSLIPGLLKMADVTNLQ